MFKITPPFFEPVRTIVWLDQFAHFVVGLLLTTLFAHFMPTVAAIVLTMILATIREMLQHPLQCHAGCRTDLLFWLLGSCMVPIILVVGE